MRTSGIIDSRLWIHHDLGSALKKNTRFQNNPSNAAHLAGQFLVYDTVAIPTKDFGIVPILISWMGLSTFMDALEAGALSFIHQEQLIGYAGNGVGISGFKIEDSQKNPFKWFSEALFGPADVAIDLQLKHHCPFIKSPERETLRLKIIEHVKEMHWDNDFFMRNIVDESLKDIMASPALSRFILQNEPIFESQVNLQNLPSVGPNQIRVLGTVDINDGVDLVLRVVEINIELLFSKFFGDADIVTSNGAADILKNKIVRAGAHKIVMNQVQTLLQLENIPDIRELVKTGNLSISEIWTIRQNKESKKFRKWLRKSSPKDAQDLVNAYISALGKSSVYSSLPVRALRFITISAVGMIEPIAGILAGAADCLFVEELLSGYSPRLFIDELRRIPYKGD